MLQKGPIPIPRKLNPRKRFYKGISAKIYTLEIYPLYGINILWIEKHLQREKLLGLAGGNTKKHGNKKFGESRTPIRYNVIHMYIFAKCFSLIISLARCLVFQGQS